MIINSTKQSPNWVHTNQPILLLDILRYLLITSKICASIVLVIGCTVVTGWILNNELLKSIVPSLPSMKTNAAIAFVFSGVCLWLSHLNQSNKLINFLKDISAIVVVAIGLLTLSQYFTGINIGIDQLVFKEPPGALGTASPNRMAPNSAALFFLCGLALLLLDKKTFPNWVSQALTVVASLIFLPTLIGYTYGIDFIYGVATTTKMAVHTAVAFGFLIIGILTARPLYGFMTILVRDDAGGFLARRLLLTGILIPFLLGWIILHGYRFGFYDANFRFLLLIGSCVIGFTFLLWQNAHSLSTIDRRRKEAEGNALFLSEATHMLNASLDYHQTLKKATEIIVPTLADICFFDILQKDGKLKRVTWKHKYQDKTIIKKLCKGFPVSDQFHYFPKKLNNNPLSPVIISPVTNSSIKESLSKGQIRSVLGLHVQTLVIIPLIVHKDLVGVATLCLTKKSEKSYSEKDISLLQELIFRAAIAVKNSILYNDAKDAVDLRDDFISAASHELNTPVTSLKLYSDGLQHNVEKIAKGKLDTYFVKINKQINKLTGLINDLLNVSRIESGKLQFEMKEFQLASLINETVENLQPTSKVHGIQIENNVAEKKVYGDRERIGQVLTNFITNAIKYSPHADKVIIKITADKEEVRIGVQDFGIGIDDKEKQKIFEKFYRANNAAGKTFPGIGIGLYISSEIIKEHKGRIWVESEKGKGSTFYFSLPLKRR